MESEMKTKYIEYGLVCDKCGRDSVTEYDVLEGHELYSNKGLTHLKKLAKVAGWLVSKEEDLCPRCYQEKRR